MADDLNAHFDMPHMRALITDLQTLPEGEMDVRRFTMTSVLARPRDA